MLEFVVIAEDETDARMVRLLANRVFLDPSKGASWLYEEILPEWRGLEEQTIYTKWTTIKQLSKQYKSLRNLGFDKSGNPKGVGYAEGIRAIFLFSKLKKTHAVEALILVKDIDDQPERRNGFDKARKEWEDEFVIVLATPNPMQEVWVLNGFVPETEQERNELEKWRHELGFDPCSNAERISINKESPQYIKRVANSLTNSSRERKERCWTHSPLAALEKLCEGTHLSAYLVEVEKRLLPLIDPSVAHREDKR